MLIMLGFSFALGASNMFLGRTSRIELSYYVVGVSFLYRLALLAVEATLMGAKNNIFISQFFMGPLVDGFISVMFFYVLVKILSLFKALEHSDSLRPGYGLYS
ncbi:MAG: hypothetical protein BWY70_01877 [Bacteroidetes bacterium ADurb.Bin408]|nr:MAG: hypothetical protein BWY70_01877 [Bacteroidetes bacterium ADurb.Bin408]